MHEALAFQHFALSAIFLALIILIWNATSRDCDFALDRGAWRGVVVLVACWMIRESYDWMTAVASMRGNAPMVQALRKTEPVLVAPTMLGAMIGAIMIARPWVQSRAGNSWVEYAAIGGFGLLLIAAGAVIHAR